MFLRVEISEKVVLDVNVSSLGLLILLKIVDLKYCQQCGISIY